MNQVQQRTLDSLRRVLAFLDEHLTVLRAIVMSQARKDVVAAVAAATEHHTTQGTATREATGQVSQQAALAKELAHSHMMPIAKFARGKLRGVPEFAELTAPVNVTKVKRLLADARSMAGAAAKYVDRFAAAGFAPDTVDKLSDAADALDEAIRQRVASHGRRKASTDAIDPVLLEGRESVTVLDALITQQLKSDDPLLATWKSESRIQDKPGRTRAKAAAAESSRSVAETATSAPASSVTPVNTPSSVAPATPKAA